MEEIEIASDALRARVPLDVTFGRDDAFGGILLRAAEPIDAPAELVEGPSLLVDHALRLTGHPSVAALAGSFEGSVDAPGGEGATRSSTGGISRRRSCASCWAR